MPIQVPSAWSLFHLPRELRDIIYNYALYEPAGLYYQRSGLYDAEFTLSPSIDGLAFNQLQYTSQQLRHETLHLERTLNTLIFQEFTTVQTRAADGDSVDNMDACKIVLKDPAVQFIGFLDTCSEASRLQLRNVRLHYNHQHGRTRGERTIDTAHNGDLINVVSSVSTISTSQCGGTPRC